MPHITRLAAVCEDDFAQGIHEGEDALIRAVLMIPEVELADEATRAICTNVSQLVLRAGGDARRLRIVITVACRAFLAAAWAGRAGARRAA